MKRKLGLLFALSLVLAAFATVPAGAQLSDGEVILELDPRGLEAAFANPDPITAAPDLACTPAHWLWPNFCKWSHITKIQGPLARCSKIWIDGKKYHIVRVYRIFRWNLIIVRPQFKYSSTGSPVGQAWEEISPEPGRTLKVTDWSDNDGDGNASAGDELKFSDGTSQVIESAGTAFSAEPEDSDSVPGVSLFR